MKTAEEIVKKLEEGLNEARSAAWDSKRLLPDVKWNRLLTAAETKGSYIHDLLAWIRQEEE